MVRRPDVRLDEERLLNSDPCWPILFVRVFGYRTSHGFNGSLPARNSIPVRIGERARPAAPDHRMWRALPVREQAPRFDPWMIFCCNAMRAEMALTDRLIFDDSKASLLTVHYALPRRQRPPKSNQV
jgi:hypothetical protein